ncbi:hypothetical protein J4207_03660 [Candidatus Woesearchaeota archaeon]|nr:hypothetical protein [Candidatus Woesearchaeota archaeon]
MLRDIFKSWRVILLLVFLLFAVISIRPSPWNEGVAIRSVEANSSAALAGIVSPDARVTALHYERILAVDNVQVSTLEDYAAAVENIEANSTIRIVTDKASYVLRTKELVQKTTLNETELQVVEEFDATTNKTIKKTIEVPRVLREVIGVEPLGLEVVQAATSNLRKGLDLAGGSRVVLKPAEAVTAQDLATIIDSLQERLNVYGLSDVSVRDATDLVGDKFIVVEIAGATEEELRDVIARQGKFEAKIGNETVFFGGNKDVAYVCRTADCSGLSPQQPCQQNAGQWNCGFFFSIALSAEAAQKHAEVTKKIAVVSEGSQRYLEKPLELFLDDVLVDTLRIAGDLKGRVETQIQISGSGAGNSRQTAMSASLGQMKRLQTVLITGSLPVKLDIVKMDTVSPVLGTRFLNNLYFVALAAFIGVIVVVLLRYRMLKIAVPMILTMISEIILILGFAALVGWNLDLAAMAGIIITIGTGVDALIVIADETIKGEVTYDWKRKLKQAMFIVFGSYLTVVAGMIPLWFAGAGLLKGFAFTTIVGVSFGVFIARPAYAAVLKILLKA